MTRLRYLVTFLLTGALLFGQDPELSEPIPFGIYDEDVHLVTVADFNGDGIEDICLSYTDGVSNSSLAAHIFILDSLGATSQTIPLLSATYSQISGSLKARDLDGDGDIDVVLTQWFELVIFYQTGPLSFTKVVYPTDETPHSLAIEDFDSDGDLDMAVGFYNGSGVHLYSWTGSSYDISNELGLLYNGYFMDAGDLDGDGDQDLIINHGSYSDFFYIIYQTELGLDTNSFFAMPQPGPPPYTSSNDLAVGDLDFDGLLDVVVVSGGNQNPNVNIFINDPSEESGFQEPVYIECQDIPEAVRIADLDCDGNGEAVIFHGGWSTMSLVEYNNESFELFEFDMPNNSHYSKDDIGFIDMNADGIKDIVVGDYQIGAYYYQNNTPVDWDQVLFESSVINQSNVLVEENFIDTIIDQYTINGMVYVNNQITDILETYEYTFTYCDTMRLVGPAGCSQLQDTVITSELCDYSYVLLDSDQYILSTYLDSASSYVKPSIFPNPNNGEFTIALPYLFDDHPTRLTISDMSGKVIYSGIIKNNLAQWNLQLFWLSRGVYSIELEHADRSDRLRWIKS